MPLVPIKTGLVVNAIIPPTEHALDDIASKYNTFLSDGKHANVRIYRFSIYYDSCKCAYMSR
jgi:hypothetical protein